MSVGAGSIKRAAKLNAEGSKVVQPKKVDAVEVKSEVAKAKRTVKKLAEEKTAPKRLCSEPICHFTEELPIYLL